MDWIQVIVIIGVNAVGFFYLAAKLDKTNDRLTKIDKDVLWIKFQHGHIPDEDQKEN